MKYLEIILFFQVQNFRYLIFHINAIIQPCAASGGVFFLISRVQCSFIVEVCACFVDVSHGRNCEGEESVLATLFHVLFGHVCIQCGLLSLKTCGMHALKMMFLLISLMLTQTNHGKEQNLSVTVMNS